jgi:S1-C subfamily serine protease
LNPATGQLRRAVFGSRRRVLALLACAAVAAGGSVAGCGGSDDKPDNGAVSLTPSNDQDGSRQKIIVSASNGRFSPAAIYRKAAPGVVTVISVFGGTSPSIFGGGGSGAGQGSGFVISREGEILTNAHVVTDAETTGTPTRPLHEASEIYVQFADRNQVGAKVVGFDPFADVALLKVDPEGIDMHPLALGSENDVQVGDAVAAIGSPFGQNQSLSVGVVSATDRSIDSLTDFGIDGALQTDASINPGNSGGPLLDADGEVVGINQQIQTSSGGNEGVGFAVPIDLAERSVEQLREDGEVSYAYAGVTTQPLYPQLADRLGIDADTGALVSRVEPGSPAEDAGLQAGDDQIRFQGQEVDAGGDVITAVDGQAIQDNSDLPRIVSRLNPGDEVTLDVIRDGEEQQIQITLGDRPTSVQR